MLWASARVLRTAPFRRAAMLVIGTVLAVGCGAASSRAQVAASDDGPNPVGTVDEKQRKAKEREDTAISEGINEYSVRYAEMKKQIKESIGLSYSMEVSLTAQWGVSGGGYGAWQPIFQPTLKWKAFDNDKLGAGSFQFQYVNAQWWSGQTGASLASALGINTPLADWPVDTQFFQEANYTHAFPGNWLSMTIGQYSFANFDVNRYANDPQVGFISLALSQNATETYSNGSLGGYLQINPMPRVRLAAGFQDGTNVSGTSVNFNSSGSGLYAWFLYGDWRPHVPNWGQGAYSFLYYSQPAVPAAPVGSQGISFNAAQPIGDRWGLFARANATWGGSFPVQTSIAAGAVMQDPLRRTKHDQIGLGFAWNAVNKSLYASSGRYVGAGEPMFEVYWAWSVLGRLLVTPDIQIYFQPALNPMQAAAAIFSLRVTKLF